jgi:hypothetical protein
VIGKLIMPQTITNCDLTFVGMVYED